MRHPSQNGVDRSVVEPQPAPARPETRAPAQVKAPAQGQAQVRAPAKAQTRPGPAKPTPTWLRSRWNDDRFIGGLCIVLLSLVVGVATFHVVSSSGAGSGQSLAPALPGTPGGAGGSASGGEQAAGGSAAGTKKPGRAASRSRVPASGELLVAPAPLNQIRQDQGSSIELPDGRTLWIFADTFQRTRAPNFFVTSAAATTEPGSRNLSYALRPNKAPVEFLPRKADEKRGSVKGEHYKAVWPVGSTLLPDGRIIIAYAKYEVLLKTGQFEFLGSGLYSYRYTNAKALHHGATATRIADDIWAPYEGEVRSPVYDNGYVYFSQCQDLRCYSLRTTPAGLADQSSYRWWTGSSWSAERNARAAVGIGSAHPGGNASVVKLESGIWAMADTEVGAPSPYGYVWVARRPWGPWSRAASYVMPGCNNGGCYGLNLHPSLSTAGILRLTYATVDGPHVRMTDVRVSIARDGSSVSAQ